jgi:hypothetical protein
MTVVFKQNVLTPLLFTLPLTIHPRLASQSLQCLSSTFEPAPDSWGVTVFTAIDLFSVSSRTAYSVRSLTSLVAARTKQNSNHCTPGQQGRNNNNNTPYSKSRIELGNTSTSQAQ